MRKKADYSKKVLIVSDTELLVPPGLLEELGYHEGETVTVEKRKAGSKLVDYVVPKNGSTRRQEKKVTQAQLAKRISDNEHKSQACVIRFLKRILDYAGEDAINGITNEKGELCFNEEHQPFYSALFREYDSSKRSYLRRLLDMGSKPPFKEKIEGVHQFHDNMLVAIEKIYSDEERQHCREFLDFLVVSQIDYWDLELQNDMKLVRVVLESMPKHAMQTEKLKKELAQKLLDWMDLVVEEGEVGSIFDEHQLKKAMEKELKATRREK